MAWSTRWENFRSRVDTTSTIAPWQAWVWGPDQEEAFGSIKEELVKPADASSYGLGAVLLQQAGEDWKPVAHASRSMTPTERRYTQTEKEALVITWACGKFSDYVLGQKFMIKSDHKPLILSLTPRTLMHYHLILLAFV